VCTYLSVHDSGHLEDACHNCLHQFIGVCVCTCALQGHQSNSKPSNHFPASVLGRCWCTHYSLLCNALSPACAALHSLGRQHRCTCPLFLSPFQRMPSQETHSQQTALPSVLMQAVLLYVHTFFVTISGNAHTTDSAPLCSYVGSAPVRAHFFCHHFRQCAHNIHRSPLSLCRRCCCTCTFSVTISGYAHTTHSAPLCFYVGSAAVRAHFFCHHFRKHTHNRQRSPLPLCRQCCCTCTLSLSPFQEMHSQHTALPSVLM